MSPLIFWQYVGWAVLAIIVIGVIVLVTMLVKDTKKRKEVPVALPSLRPVSPEEEKKKAIFDGTESVGLPSRKSRRKGTENTGPSKESLPAKSSAFFDSEDDEDFKLPSGSD